MYSVMVNFLRKFMKASTIYKYGFNWSPMYRRTTARIVAVSDDLYTVRVKIPYSYKNKNYVGSIFGGSLFAALDPILMIQGMNILGDSYIVWDKAATIRFKRPARENVFADFILSQAEIDEIKEKVKENGEYDFHKTIKITNAEGTIVYCEVDKVLYCADKTFYKEKTEKRKALRATHPNEK